MKFTTFPLLPCLLLLLSSPSAPAQSLLIPEGSDWLYSDTGPLTGTTWRTTAFDDSAWASGPAPLGYGDGGELRAEFVL